MNARQKAKKYKKLVAEYKPIVDAYHRLIAVDKFNTQAIPYDIKDIRYVRLFNKWDLAQLPETVIKREMAMDIGLSILENSGIHFKVEDRPELDSKQFTAKIKLAVERCYDEQTHSIL